jgi:ABC-type multidrug transport system fused ATPase/permease subunit
MRILLRLTGYAAQYRGELIAAYVSVIGATLLYLAVPRLLGTAIDEALTQGSGARLWALGGAIVAVTVGRGVFSYYQTYLGEAVSQRVAYSLRNAFYDKLQRLSFAFHDREHTGNLMSKGTVDVENIRWFISMGLIRSINLVLMVLVTAVLLLLMDWQLGLVSLFFVPIIAIRAVSVSLRMRLRWRRVQEELGQMTTVLQENLTGMRVVKAFGAEKYEQAKFDECIDRVYDANYSAQRLMVSNSSFMQFIFLAATGLILWFGGRAVIDDRLTPGELAQFLLYIGVLVQPIRMTGFLMNTFARAISAGERIFAVLDTHSPVAERPNAKPMAKVQGRVEFENITFAYTHQPAVHQVNLSVTPGQVVALLGSPGSGKTTLMHLLARFYDVDQGRITIDGTDIRDVTLESLRRSVGVIQQDAFLFSATVGENIAYGRMDATAEEIAQAAKTAQLHDEIMEMSNGYGSPVGERGLTLSGGQRQRLSIARTLLLDPPILVMDDSTSSVDAATEASIQRAMAAIAKGRTTFIIAHRLTSVQHADLAVVMNHGRIAEAGPPQELMAKDGFYRHIVELQRASHDELFPTELRPQPGLKGGTA